MTTASNKATLTHNTIEGTLVFVTIQTPQTKYQSDDKEYKVGIVVDEDTADSWNERFPKQTAETTGLVWCKEVILPEETDGVEDTSKQGSTGEAYIRTRQEIRDHATKLAQRLLSKKCDKEFQIILKK